jgi:hypothetical protein
MGHGRRTEEWPSSVKNEVKSDGTDNHSNTTIAMGKRSLWEEGVMAVLVSHDTGTAETVMLEEIA